MTCAKLTPQKFQECYNRFQNTYGNAEGPVVVMYFRLNDKVCVYMKYVGITWKTEIGYEDASKYLQIFNSPIQLTEQLDD